MKLPKALAVVLTACAMLLSAHGQTLELTPPQVMNDESAAIRVTGLQPGQHVALRSDLVDGEDQAWTAEAEFVADVSGTVDATRQAPMKGSYKTVSAMGLVWSMTPATKNVHIYRPPHNLAPQTIAFHLLVDGKEAATAQLQQLAVAAGVRRTKVEGALRGEFFAPAGEGKHAAVLVLGGSEGGTPTGRAAWLASHGYAALALCYFRCEGRPDTLLRIPLEYFQQALGWLMERPEVDGERLGVMGVSRGGELALQLGSMFPALKAVVAYVPANVRYPACCGYSGLMPAWTWRGRDLSYAPPRLRDPDMAMEAAIHVELTHGAILMIGGRDDGVWPSAEMVETAAARLRSAHFAYPVVTLVYPHAGHRAGLPEIIPAWNKGSTHPVTGTPVDYGGTPEGNAESTLDAIPKVLEFLRDALVEKDGPAKAAQ
ncbi:MAG TPA: acyl-CoA thioesterase/bile acid-CoA:amino acid N-acyltransferase family protein [Terracidiphilus sp.]|nr:acyl-CoA thioesterase/bile acid-CoA:amino acid N-acyltransferase family protein [Terracidiphilus sp.]